MKPRAAMAGLALAIVTAAGGAGAAISVTSGEHDAFSRLVFRLPAGAEWSLEMEAGGGRLRVTEAETGFDLRRAFDKIPRTRVEALRDLGGGVLGLDLACPCPVEAYRFRGRYLVLDVRDPGPDTPGPPTAGDPLLPVVADRPTPIALDRLGPATPPPIAQAANRPAPGLGAALARDITRAAGLGVLEPALQLPKDPPAPPPVSKATATSQAPAPAPRAAHQVQVETRTGLDDSLKALATALPALLAAEKCVPNTALDLAGWRDERPFALQLGALRAGLLSEFDRPVADAARDLARFYVASGFGEEARAVMRSFDLAEAYPALWDIAGLLDGGAGTRSDAFRHQAGCDGHAALWSVLADTPGDDPWNIAAILRSFSDMPGDLRQHLAPPLAARLQAKGEAEAAQAILRTAGRGVARDGPGLAYARATIGPAGLGESAAQAILSAESKRNSPLSPQALIALVDMRLARGEAPDPGWPDLLAAYAREHAGNALGDALAQRQVRVQAHSARFDAAFADLPDGLPAPILSDMAVQLARRADDVTFLKYALDSGRLPRRQLAADATDALETRLAALGFAGPAHTPTDSARAGVPDPERAFKDGDPEALGQFRLWTEGRPAPPDLSGPASLATARATLDRAEGAQNALRTLLSGTALPQE